MGLPSHPDGPQRPDDPNPFETGRRSIDSPYHHHHPSPQHLQAQPQANLSSPTYSPNPAYNYPTPNSGYACPGPGYAPPSPSAAPYPIHQGYGYNPSQYHHYNQYPDPMVAASPYQYQHPPYNNTNGSYYYQPQPNYINPNYPPPGPDPHIDNDTSSFGRMMLILLIILIVSMVMLAFIVWFLFGHYIPDFQVTALSVSKFCTNTSRTLSGNWNATVFVHNENKELHIYFDEVISAIHYEDALLGSSPINPFQVASMEQYFLNFTMPETAFHQKFEGPDADHLAVDLSHGLVAFNIRTNMKATFKTPNNKVYKTSIMKLWCPGLQVRFSASGDGVLEPIMDNSCLISIRDLE